MVEKENILGTFTAQRMSEDMRTPESEEIELVRLARSGNRKAFDRLVEKYHGQVYQLAFRFFNNKEDAQDATQEVFLKVYRALGNFEGRSSFKTWIFRITSNTCSTICQEKTKNKKTLLQALIDWFSKPPVQDPSRVVTEKEYQMELQSAITEKISKLPEAYRMPLILRDIEGYSHERICEILDLKEGTVKSRINRGRRILQESLESFFQRKESL